MVGSNALSVQIPALAIPTTCSDLPALRGTGRLVDHCARVCGPNRPRSSDRITGVGDSVDGMTIIYSTSQYRGGTGDAPVLFQLPKTKVISFQDCFDRVKRHFAFFAFKYLCRITLERDFEHCLRHMPSFHPKIGKCCLERKACRSFDCYVVTRIW